ncbi:MAG TPA: FliH/SctL family protein [Dissulfurispiraceae bacterium]|nr:FliH/SctL family protein [Dissulfurispiraceae bacterium]
MAKNLSADKKTSAVTRYVPAAFDQAGSENKLDDPKQKAEMLKKIEEQGFEKGFAAGFEKGIAAGQEEIIDRLARVDSIILELEKFKEKKLQETLPEIVDLALEIAGRVIHKKIEQDREIIVSVVRDAVRKLGREEKMVIRVNPLDYDTMISSLEALREEARLRDISIEPADSVSAGGCYIETPTAEVDARVEEQIRELRDAIDTALDS